MHHTNLLLSNDTKIISIFQRRHNAMFVIQKRDGHTEKQKQKTSNFFAFSAARAVSAPPNSA